MKSLEIEDVQQHFTSVLITMKADGEGILICQDGKPIADLIPHQEDEARTKATDEDHLDEEKEAVALLEKLRPIARRAGIILPKTRHRKASVPTLTVEGTPLSQIIVEDRR